MELAGRESSRPEVRKYQCLEIHVEANNILTLFAFVVVHTFHVCATCKYSVNLVTFMKLGLADRSSPVFAELLDEFLGKVIPEGPLLTLVCACTSK
jgi:hypothetical protein